VTGIGAAALRRPSLSLLEFAISSGISGCRNRSVFGVMEIAVV